MPDTNPTPVDLDALEALANAATPGHWVVRRWRVSYDGTPQEPYDEGDRWEITAADGAGVVDVELDRDYNDPEGGCLNERDAYFIAAAREAIPALIAELRSARAAIPGSDSERIRELEAENEWMRDRLDELVRITIVADLRAAGLLPGPDTITVNREAVAHLLRHGAPDMAVTSLDDAARWDDISDVLRAALSEPPAPKEQQP
jgi:hypothetical protein